MAAKNNFDQSLSAKAWRIVGLFRASVPPGDAATRTGVAPTTVKRLYRAFRLISKGKTDQDIDGMMKDFSSQTVAMLRAIYQSTGPGTGRRMNVKRFVDDHRSRLHRLVKDLADSLPDHVAAWPLDWLKDEWPRPWSGPVIQSPCFKVEKEEEFYCLPRHLENLSFEDHVQLLAQAANAVRNAAVELECSLPADAVQKLPRQLLLAAIEYGAQMAQSPTQSLPRIEVSLNDKGRFMLHVGAYGVWFDSEEDARAGQPAVLELIEATRTSTYTEKFYQERDRANDALRALKKVLKIEETVRLEIDLGKCMACEALVAFADGADEPLLVV